MAAALAAYQDERLPPTAKIVMANRANGPDHVLQLAEERAPDGFDDVHAVIPKAELDGIGAAYKAVAGFDRDGVNRRAQETEGMAERWLRRRESREKVQTQVRVSEVDSTTAANGVSTAA